MMNMEKWVDHAQDLYNKGIPAKDAIKEARVLMNSNNLCEKCKDNKSGFCFKTRKSVKEIK